MRKLVSTLALLLVGFCAYPLLFVPLFGKFAPELLDRYVELYMNYLRLWGL